MTFSFPVRRLTLSGRQGDIYSIWLWSSLILLYRRIHSHVRHVTRPTSLAELNREAGIYSTRNCHVYVSSCATPLAADEVVYLDHGALVRYVPVDQAPGEVRRLHHRLQDFDTWQFEQAAPRILREGSVMLMHPRGRFILSRNTTPGLPLDVAAADFVGIARGSVSFRTPEDGYLQRPAHRGSNLRGGFRPG